MPARKPLIEETSSLSMCAAEASIRKQVINQKKPNVSVGSMRRVNFCCFVHWCSSPSTQNNAWHILGTQYLLNEWTQGSQGQATQESVPQEGKGMSAPRSRWWQWPWEGSDPGSTTCGDPVWPWQVSCHVKWGLSITDKIQMRNCVCLKEPVGAQTYKGPLGP